MRFKCEEVEQITVSLENRPGVLADLCAHLSDHHINLRALVALDGTAEPQISYYDSSNQAVKLAWHRDGSWHNGVVDSFGGMNNCTALVLDTNGLPHVSYTGQGIKYAYVDGSTNLWHYEVVDNSLTVSGHTSLVLDGSGKPVVSYYDQSNQDLKMMHCNDASCAGDDESIVAADTGGVGGHEVLDELSSSGCQVELEHRRRDLVAPEDPEPSAVGRPSRGAIFGLGADDGAGLAPIDRLKEDPLPRAHRRDELPIRRDGPGPDPLRRHRPRGAAVEPLDVSAQAPS